MSYRTEFTFGATPKAAPAPGAAEQIGGVIVLTVGPHPVCIP